MYKTVIYVVLAFTILGSGQSVDVMDDMGGIQCYYCKDDAEICPYTGFEPSANVTTNNCHYGTCVKKTEKATNGNKEKVTRRCLLETERENYEYYLGCKDTVEVLVSTKVDVEFCVCHNDLCNSAADFILSPLLLAVALLSALLA